MFILLFIREWLLAPQHEIGSITGRYIHVEVAGLDSINNLLSLLVRDLSIVHPRDFQDFHFGDLRFELFRCFGQDGFSAQTWKFSLSRLVRWHLEGLLSDISVVRSESLDLGFVDLIVMLLLDVLIELDESHCSGLTVESFISRFWSLDHLSVFRHALWLFLAEVFDGCQLVVGITPDVLFG